MCGICYNSSMSNDEILKFVIANNELEGVVLSGWEKRTVFDCLIGRKDFDEVIRGVFRKYQRGN